jgi:hypothetical protein
MYAEVPNNPTPFFFLSLLVIYTLHQLHHDELKPSFTKLTPFLGANGVKWIISGAAKFDSPKTTSDHAGK